MRTIRESFAMIDRQRHGVALGSSSGQTPGRLQAIGSALFLTCLLAAFAVWPQPVSAQTADAAAAPATDTAAPPAEAPKAPPVPADTRKPLQFQEGEDLVEPLQPLSPRDAAAANVVAARAWYGTGRVLEAANNFQGAYTAYRKAIELDPSAIMVYRALIQLAFSLNQIDDAIQYAMKAVELDPTDFQLLRRIGVHQASQGDYAGANAEDPDEYKAENVFWVPAEGRWSHLQANAKQPTIGKLVDDAMVAIERDNPRLKGVLPKDYARPGLDKQRLGELIDLIATIDLIASSQPSSPTLLPTGEGSKESELPSTSGRGAGGEGRPTHRSVDLLGRVYEYFLGRFASAEGKRGGEFYTPQCVDRVLVEMIAPYKGRIYDPCNGSGGLFVQSEKFIEAHGGKRGDIAIIDNIIHTNT